ncbi:hypothetical protein B6I21_08215, partial [candidate division KSB1 bacterium 4572_119]
QKQEKSGGLTYDVTNAENHTSIVTIAPSPRDRNVIWVGTDDGQVQITRDGGKTWTNVTGRIPKLPDNTWCPHIEASKFAGSTCYAVFEDHRRSNWTTYIYKTENYGKKWKSLTKNNPISLADAGAPEEWGFAHVIEQDPVKKELLYLGTEFGLFISFNDGKNWMKWKHGVPTVPVRALIVHPRDHDLIIGTHGRAAFVLDDVRPLRSISEKLLAKQLHVFEVVAAYQHHIKAVAGYHFPADAIFQGENRAYGALITYYLNPDQLNKEKKVDTEKAENVNNGKVKKKKNVNIEIYSASDKLVRKLENPVKGGLNRIFWNFPENIK